MWTYEGPASLVILFFHTLCYLSAVSLTALDYIIGIRLDALKNYYVLVLWMLPHGLVENDSHVLP